MNCRGAIKVSTTTLPRTINHHIPICSSCPNRRASAREDTSTQQIECEFFRLHQNRSKGRRKLTADPMRSDVHRAVIIRTRAVIFTKVALRDPTDCRLIKRHYISLPQCRQRRHAVALPDRCSSYTSKLWTARQYSVCLWLPWKLVK